MILPTQFQGVDFTANASFDLLRQGASSTLTLQISFASTSLSRTGVVVDDFQILGELGRGGMGIVFHASDRKCPEMVALKTLHRMEPCVAFGRTNWTRPFVC